MSPIFSLLRPSAVAVAALLLAVPVAARAADPEKTPCTEDVMIVFDASGSMAGNVNSPPRCSTIGRSPAWWFS
jgi:hypothetical protein